MPASPLVIHVANRLTVTEEGLYTAFEEILNHIGVGGEIVVQIPFSFDAISPIVLQGVLPGQILNRAVLLVDIPFDDPSATLQVGTSTLPGGILDGPDSTPGVSGQYESDVLFPFAISDFLLLSISPGASTQGSGILLYKMR